MLTITLNDPTASQVTKMAEAQSTSPEELIEKAIHDLLHAEASRILARETAVFRTLHAQLLQKYPGEYVALHQGQMIDHDPDQLALYLRVDEQYPDEVILIKQVCSEIEEIYNIRSPRLTNV